MNFWSIIKLLPFLIDIFRKALVLFYESKKRSQEKQNAEIRKAVENAKTPEERQAAIDRAAARFGKP